MIERIIKLNWNHEINNSCPPNPPTYSQNSETLTMSFFDATLMIGYSRPEYNPVFVKHVFDTIFGAGVVEQVREFVVTSADRPTYKRFYIYTFDDYHPAIVRIINLIDTKKFAKVAFKQEWDYKTQQAVDRYWKVFRAPVMKLFIPYLMNEEPAIASSTIDPWSPEADPAFADARCALTQLAETQFAETQRTLEFPPPMVRDETENWGTPCKLERSTNDPPADEDTADEEYEENVNDATVYEVTAEEAADVSKDFDELASAIAEFGEDYPGSIARPMVRCDSEQFPDYGAPTEMVRDESDRYIEPYMLRLETDEDGTSKICRGEDPADYIEPPPKLVRSTTEWFGQ